jgi:hypothetical protein
MARVDFEEMGDPAPIFIAKSVRLATRVEAWLTMAGIDYAVQVVPSPQAEQCRRQLTAAGLGAGVVEEEAQGPVE